MRKKKANKHRNMKSRGKKKFQVSKIKEKRYTKLCLHKKNKQNKNKTKNKKKYGG